jgi:N-ethylmaleimide reductase
MKSPLFSPVQLGDVALANRIVMAPMTRDRAGEGDIATSTMVEYYRQRATAGMIVSEGVQPSAEGKGYWRTPGIWSSEQTESWRRVCDAVHAEGGKLAIQIMHCGRVVVPANRGYDAEIVAPSALPCPEKVPGPDGVPTSCGSPRALSAAELPDLAAQFAGAARNAIDAGADAVELHCASGYLINQFLNPASNRRSDSFGGSPSNRIAFPMMVLEAMASAVGAGRIGFRISPGNPYNAMDPTLPEETFVPFLRAADTLGLAWVHVVDMGLPDLDTLGMIQTSWSGPVIANNNLKADSAGRLVEAGLADATSFGRAFIANPDLVRRIRDGAPLAKPDYAHLYTGEERGYTDYPFLD